MTLDRGKPLRADPAKVREWQDRSRKPLPASSGRRRSGPTPETRAAVRWRAGNCEAAIAGVCTRIVEQLHHIKRRSQGGGHGADNLLGVCAACHGWIHEHPKLAYERGLLKRGDGD